MANIIEMPKLSDDMTVGTLIKWLKQEGDIIKSGDALADIETDKATLELESPFGGVLLKKFVGAGAKVPVALPLCVIGQSGEEFAMMEAESPVTLEPPISADEEMSIALANLVASLPGEPKERTRNEILAPPAAPAIRRSTLRRSAPQAQRIKISPLARKAARAKSIDLSTVVGSGPGGRIVRKDILASGEQPASKATSTRQECPDSETFQAKQDRTVPAFAKRATARQLIASKTQIPHFYLEMEIDAAPMLAFRSQLNAAWKQEGVKISVNDLILKASALALMKVSEVNMSWSENGIRTHAEAHISFAVASDNGLVTPVVRNAWRKSIAAISIEAKDLVARSRERELSPEECTGGTFCVTNLGMLGVSRFSAIIYPPNAAILAVGATVRKPVVRADQVVIGDGMALTLSCDHRVVDGAIGARFLNEVRGFLEVPFRLLFDPLSQSPANGA